MKKTFTYTLPLVLLLMTLFTGCQVNYYDTPPPPPPPCHGQDGLPGRAYLGLDFAIDIPEYVWGSNTHFPGNFSYGQHYLTTPGFYELYYEGAYYDGYDRVEYQWEIDYELWVHPGAPGSCYNHGPDGPDSYLMIIMGPFGPDFDRLNKQANGVTIDKKTENEIIITQETKWLKLVIRYKKAKKSLKETYIKKELTSI